MLPGIICYFLHPDLSNPDEAFMTMVTNYLPTGMTGLIVAVLIAALVSTVDSGLNSFSTVFTLDIYVKKYRPTATPAEIVWVGRVVMVLVAVNCCFLSPFYGKFWQKYVRPTSRHYFLHRTANGCCIFDWGLVEECHRYSRPMDSLFGLFYLAWHRALPL